MASTDPGNADNIYRRHVSDLVDPAPVTDHFSYVIGDEAYTVEVSQDEHAITFHDVAGEEVCRTYVTGSMGDDPTLEEVYRATRTEPLHYDTMPETEGWLAVILGVHTYTDLFADDPGK